MLRNWKKKRRNYNHNKEKEIKNGRVERNKMEKRKSTKPNFKIFENINILKVITWPTEKERREKNY